MTAPTRPGRREEWRHGGRVTVMAVLAGLVPAIHDFSLNGDFRSNTRGRALASAKTWMAGSSPAMTGKGLFCNHLWIYVYDLSGSKSF